MFLEGGDQFAVAHPLGFTCRADLYVPRLAELALALFSPAEFAGECVEERFLCGALFRFAPPLEPLGSLEYFCAALIRGGASFYAWHVSSS